MTITQLRYVLAVAEHKNFTKAAEHAFVTQPTLSMQIHKLEEELGVEIFNRNKKPIALTQVGQKIVEQARNIVNESFRIQDIVEQQKGHVGGEFKLAIIPTIMPTLLPMFLKNFINRYAKVNLKILELNTADIILKLKSGQIDAAIAATPLEAENIVEKPLYYEPFVGYIPESHQLHSKSKLSPEDLDADDILLLEDGHCFKDNVLNICKNRNAPHQLPYQIESGSFETLIKLSHEGLGMTLLPYLQTLELSSKLQSNLKNFKNPKPAREVSLIYHKSELKLQIIKALQDTITGVIKGAIAFQDVDIVSPIPKQ
ncbi:LysR family transcriptional regulator [Mesohalobacter halotolerans]|uniref:LysR family transcriptional regulator n=1 Tax=Mesohalobacter halotolerans TaxID=1883405 RepID=A0A4U5TR94_9FLAO|nr:LysR substrate-binding domain-containing protein [Mesohalobacter halotolerans]MBS3739423.1 LysR family transcriptional regulator [Psychroflexus sp.]TKS56759.1 LysR family transcriptional regulator [Mesohalobacter halotolerans]